MNRSDDYIMDGASGSAHDQWKRVFDEASEAPPPRVWDAVERQLDLDDEDGIIPLWQHHQGQQSMLFGRWAAGIAASLLLTLFGWWAWHRTGDLRPDSTGVHQVAVSSPQVTPVNPLPTPAAVSATQPRAAVGVHRADVPTNALASRTLAPSRRNQSAVVSPVESPVAPAVPSTEAVAEARPETPQPALAGAVPVAVRVADEPSTGPEQITITHNQVTTRMAYGQITMSLTTSQSAPISFSNRPQLTTRPLQLARTQSIADQLPTPQPDASGLVPPTVVQPSLTEGTADRLALNLTPLSIQPLSVRAVGNDRIVWYRTEQSDVAPTDAKTTTSRTERRKAWVSAGIVAAAFNPELAVRSTTTPTLAMAADAYPNQFNNLSIGATPSISARTGSALTVQVQTGLPLGEHWAVETGVGYLSGQASVQSPSRSNYAYNSSDANNATLYSDLINNRLSANSAAYSSVANSLNDPAGSSKVSRYVTTEQTVSNTYQFVQVPAQVSYEFRPRRKFGLALLTGLVSNWFVRNTINQTVEVKAADGVYRPVTMAGTAGVRLRYRPDAHWSASMAGSFQQNLQSLTLNDVNLQALPQQVGLSFSVDRHF